MPSPDHLPHEPVVIPPPGSVRIAALAVGIEGVGLLLLAALTLISGIKDGADGVQLGAEVAYFVILGAALCLVSAHLMQGRRWARSPAIVVQIVVVAVGFWMAFPSAQLPRGLALMGLGAVTLSLLVSRRANLWIRQFPAPFGIGEDED